MSYVEHFSGAYTSMKQYQLHVLCRLLIAVLILCAQDKTQAQPALPDPTLLLQGVVSSRLQFPALEMEVEMENSDSFGKHTADYSIEFDGERRRFRRLDPPGRAARAAYDGREIVCYDPSLQVAEKRFIDGYSRDFAFDPRTLGVNHYFLAPITIHSALQFEDGGAAVLVGKELISSNETWHVKVTPSPKWNNPEGYFIDVWIDAQFRVHRYVQNGVEVVSYYNKDVVEGLPNKVIATRKVNGAVNGYTSCVIRKAKLIKDRLPDSTWTIEGINPPNSTPVHDIPSAARVGYWDGTRVVASFVEAQAAPVRVEKSKVWFFRIILCLFAIAPVTFLVKRRLSRQGKRPA